MNMDEHAWKIVAGKAFLFSWINGKSYKTTSKVSNNINHSLFCEWGNTSLNFTWGYHITYSEACIDTLGVPVCEPTLQNDAGFFFKEEVFAIGGNYIDSTHLHGYVGYKPASKWGK